MKTKQSKSVPELRFPGFVGEWKSEQLDSIASKKISYGIVQAGEHIPGGMPYIKSQDLNQTLELESLQRTSDEIARKYRRSEVVPGDIVFSLRGNIGVCRIVPLSIPVANLTQGTARIAVANHDNRLVAQTLQTTNVARAIDACAKGSTFREISLEALRKISLPLAHTLPEQRKIADFLTAVDGRIGQLIQKKALLEDYKKGVMQQLFTQAIRFKDDHGNDFPEWEEKKLGEWVNSFGLGGNYSNSEAVTENPLIKMGNLGRGLISLKKLEYVLDSDEVAANDLLKNGDLLFNTRNTLDLVGKVAIWREELPKAYYNSNIMRLEFQNTWFMNYWFNSHQGLKSLRRIATGTTSVAAIYTKDLMKVVAQVPTLPEQTKIADFLSALDRKIESVATQITETQTFKRGLLQQMFV